MSDFIEIRLREHLLLLTALLMAGVLLARAPQFVLALHYRCVLNTLIGIRCPFCGMSRDFILISKGLLPRHNPGSVVVALAIYGCYPLWFLVAIVSGNTLLRMRRDLVLQGIGVLLVALFIANNVPLWRI